MNKIGHKTVCGEIDWVWIEQIMPVYKSSLYLTYAQKEVLKRICGHMDIHRL